MIFDLVLIEFTFQYIKCGISFCQTQATEPKTLQFFFHQHIWLSNLYMPLFKAFAGPCARLPKLGCSCAELLVFPFAFALALGWALPHQGILVWSFLRHWLQLGLQLCFALWSGTPDLTLALFLWQLCFRGAGFIL